MTIEQQIVDVYEQTQSLRATSKQLNIDWQVVRRVLITHNSYSTPMTTYIADLINSGVTADEIAEKLNVTKSCIISNMPYTKGSYVVGEKSKNAMQIARCRENKKKREVYE